MIGKILTVSAALIFGAAVSGQTQDMMKGEMMKGGMTKFNVRIENITKPDAFTASNGVKWSLGFSPGVAVIHTDKAPLFTAGKKDRGQGLEAQSEDGDPGMFAKSLQGGKGIKSVAVFNVPVDTSAPGPIIPGAAYEFTISAMPGDRLSLTTMMGQSNDW